MEEFMRFLALQFGDGFIEKQLQELPPEVRELVSGMLGIGRNTADENLRKHFDSLLSKKDKVIDDLLEKLHAHGVKTEEVVLGDNAPEDKGKNIDAIVALLIEKDIVSLEELIANYPHLL